jgi:4-alpha-glucanotransferase
MIDWASTVGLKLVQILPVNDTIATHGWMDSYPYAAISVFALHPMYLNLEEMGMLKDPELQKEFEDLRQKFNQSETVDYLEVMKAKSRYFKLLFDQEKGKFRRTKAFKEFFTENQDWLVPYAAFSRLRDLNGTADFKQWEEHAVFDEAEILAYVDPKQDHHDDIAIHYFIQYHLHLQLKAASDYASDKGIVFKGDIPIGIYRHSVDAWVAPHLYHMHAQAGAPPDAFAVKGQNWRFPTYNWEVMAQDDYAWWRQRLSHMARYFDAYRIDHILGFFRIWQIPGHAVEGLLGQFNPALPLQVEELHNWGLWWEEDRFTLPYVRTHMLQQFFGDRAEGVQSEFFHDLGYNIWQFKEGLGTQRELEAYFDQQIQAHPERAPYLNGIREGLYALASEVLFLPAINGRPGFDPRIAFHHTFSYQELDGGTKERLNEIYNHYFYHRHEAFWRDSALVKLPAIQAATDMLVCGEDLGMVPDCVPGVMNELGILSLEIQRMPKDSAKEFAHPGDAPYLSVVSPSTHDMSTVRGWWEEDRTVTQRFFNHSLGQGGEAPWFCEPWIAEVVLNQHLHSPAMWTIFPLQDLFAIDGDLRKEDPHSERINVPANSQHHWEYRMHIGLEDLMKADDFNQKLRHLIQASGRNEAV